jgi:LPXTG-motif cell wall-anchored protein
VVIPDRPIVPPCAHSRPGSVPSWVTDKTADDQPIATPCGLMPPRPAAVPDRPIVPPCAHGRPVAPSSPVGADQLVTVPCGASRPVILPARPVVVPDAPVTPPCAGAQGRPGAEQAKPLTPPSSAADKPAQGTDKPAGKPGTAVDKPGTAADRPVAAAPCGAAAARPVEVPGQPMVVPHVPAVPPCAQGRPGACGCLNSQHAPAAPAAAPAAPAAPVAPVAPVVPGSQGVAPCAAEDKPMADGKAAAERPLAPSCEHDAPAAVHQEPGVTPDTVAPMTPLMSPGKSAHPLGRPHRHFPRSSGLAHRDCVRQGAGFVCPLGSAPHRRPHALNLGAPGRPHRLNCVGAETAGCHTRAARLVAVRPQPVRRQLPTTGGSSELLALSGLGLAGAGVVLFGLSRTRRRRGEEV